MRLREKSLVIPFSAWKACGPRRDEHERHDVLGCGSTASRLHRVALHLLDGHLFGRDGGLGLGGDGCGDGGRGHLLESCDGKAQETGCGSYDKNGDYKYYDGMSVGGKMGRRMKEVVPLRNG